MKMQMYGCEVELRVEENHKRERALKCFCLFPIFFLMTCQYLLAAQSRLSLDAARIIHIRSLSTQLGLNPVIEGINRALRNLSFA